MKRIAIILALSLSLGGCWNPFQTITNPVSATNLYEAELLYDAGLKTFNQLKKFCADRTIPASCRKYVIQAQAIIPKAEAAHQAAINFVQNNPTIDATNVVSAFSSLVSDFKNTLAALGSLKGAS